MTVNTLLVSAGLALQHDRSSVRHEEPRPDQKHAILPEGDVAVVGADKLRALRDEEIFPGRAVVDVLGDVRGGLSGQIGADPSGGRRRMDLTGLERKT